MRTHVLILLAFLAAIASSCIMIGNCVDGNGNTTTEERTVANFTSVSNETSFEVIYRRSDVVSVTVEAESNTLRPTFTADRSKSGQPGEHGALIIP
jgi:hypothetical protein